MFDPNGTFHLDGSVLVGHTMFEVRAIMNAIDTYKPDHFIEIGLHQGGLSYILIQTFPEIHYVGVELDCNLLRPDALTLFGLPNSHLICGSCFSEKVELYIATLEGKRLIYCDGGDKAKEIKTFKPLVMVSDIIMCHDYWDGESKIRAVPKPNAEVTPEDVKMYREDERFVELSFPGTRVLGFMRTE